MPIVVALIVAAIDGSLALHPLLLAIVLASGVALSQWLASMSRDGLGRNAWAPVAAAFVEASTLYVATVALESLVVPALFVYCVAAVFHASSSGLAPGLVFLAVGVLGSLTHLDALAGSDLGRPMPALTLLVCATFATWVASAFARTFTELSHDLERARARNELETRHAVEARTEAQELAGRARRRSDALERAREELLRTASHELRTPLTAVAGALEVLDDRLEHLSPARLRTLVSIARRSATDLTHTTEQVLDLVRLADSDEGLPVEDFDLLEVFQYGLQRVEHLMPDRMVTVDTEGDTNALGDPTATARVVENLLSNVVHHTPPGTSAHVRIGRAEGLAFLEVRDEGEGVPQDAMTLLTRGEAATERSRGLGIGLVLCERYARAQGGRFELIGAPSGTTARLWLSVPARTWTPHTRATPATLTPVVRGVHEDADAP